jgi:putative transposase
MSQINGSMILRLGAPFQLKDHGIIQSMSRKGHCWDNAASESFFSTIKGELIELSDFADQKKAAAAIFEYIEVFYNRIRAHSAIGYRAPEEFENLNVISALRKNSVR